VNPFVNPKKRSVLLPSGCKDLIDALKRSENRHGSAIRRFIHLFLLQAQQDQATELDIGAVPISGFPMIRYKVEGTWYDISTFPSHIRPDVIAELARMAKIPVGQFPMQGVLNVTFRGFRSRWIVAMASADESCMLVRFED
jgi:hypothetical protein